MLKKILFVLILFYFIQSGQAFANNDNYAEIYYFNGQDHPNQIGIVKEKAEVENILRVAKALKTLSAKNSAYPKYIFKINYSGQMSKIGYTPGRFVIKGNNIKGYKSYVTQTQTDRKLEAVLKKLSVTYHAYPNREKGICYYPWETNNFCWNGGPNYKGFYIGANLTFSNLLKTLPDVDYKNQVVIQLALADKMELPSFKKHFSTSYAIRITRIDNYYPGYVKVFFKVIPVNALPITEKLTPYFDSVKVDSEKFYTKGYKERLTFSFISEDGKNLGFETSFRQDLRKISPAIQGLANKK